MSLRIMSSLDTIIDPNSGEMVIIGLLTIKRKESLLIGCVYENAKIPTRRLKCKRILSEF